MKVLFLFDDLILGQEPLGVTTISAVLKREGHLTEAINMDAIPDPNCLVEEVRKRKADVLAVSTCSGQHVTLLERSKGLKEALGLPVICGGPHPTYFPDIIEHPGVDVICRSEGEYPMLEYVTALQDGTDYTKIPNLWVKKDGVIHRNGLRPNLEDLDSLPFSDKELVRPFEHLWRDKIGYFITARGCPLDCSFCYNNAQRELETGPNVRRRSVQNVLKELHETKEKYGFRYIAFQDDVFLIQPRWLNAFLPLYRDQIRLPFHCHSIATLMKKEEFFQSLAEAGCVRIFFAIETGDEETRRTILKKAVKNEDLFRARDMCEKFDIESISSIMVGIPGETVESTLGSIEMTIKCRVHCFITHFFMPYPGTELGDLARNMGVFDGNFDSIPACNHDKLRIRVDGDPETIERLGLLAYWFREKPWKFYATKFLFKHIQNRGLRILWLKYLQSLIKPGVWPECVYHLPEPERIDMKIQQLEKGYEQRRREGTLASPEEQLFPAHALATAGK